MIHKHGYWLEISNDNKHVCDVSLLNILVQIFDVNSVVDIGCGDGSYVRGFLDKGIECIGYDGSPLTPEVSGGLCKVMDFAVPIDIGRFDLVLSLEVGEHIPEKYEPVFIDNLCQSSSAFICLSWGIPGQPGYGHVNNRDNYYIIGEMNERGFKIDHYTTKLLRDNSTFDWFKNTLMVFER